MNRRLQYLLVILLALGVAADSGLAALGAQRGGRVLGLVDRSTPQLRARLHPGRDRPAAVLDGERRRAAHQPRLLRQLLSDGASAQPGRLRDPPVRPGRGSA